jgi:hypothetical protein
MVLHAASGSLITFATMFWGFWSIQKKTINLNVGGNPLAKGSALHSLSGVMVALMALPLVVTGFIPYFRRWQAESGSTTLMRLRDFHKVSSTKLNDYLVLKLHFPLCCSLGHSNWY